MPRPPLEQALNQMELNFVVKFLQMQCIYLEVLCQVWYEPKYIVLNLKKRIFTLLTINSDSLFLDNFCAIVLMNYFFVGKSDLPWSGMTFGLAISSIWYWCSDQVSSQLRYFQGRPTYNR